MTMKNAEAQVHKLKRTQFKRKLDHLTEPVKLDKDWNKVTAGPSSAHSNSKICKNKCVNKQEQIDE